MTELWLYRLRLFRVGEFGFDLGLDEAVARRAAQTPGLGERFVVEMQTALKRMAERPQA